MSSNFILIALTLSVAFLISGTTSENYVGKEEEDFPFPVSIQYLSKHICSGAVVIAKDIIVTAARCCYTLDPDRGIIKIESNDLQVRAGSTNWMAGGTLHDVYTYEIHEDHNLATGLNDIAVIQLTSAVHMNVQPIGLSLSRPRATDRFYFAGWEKTTDQSNVFSAVMLYNVLSVIPKNECQLWLNEKKAELPGNDFSFAHSTDTGFCAKPDSNRKCFGDTGGALISKRNLIAISSIVTPCKLYGKPAFFTSINTVRSWILKTIEMIRNEV